MRVEISTEDAATVIRALSHAGPPADRIAELFKERERPTAVLMPVGAEQGTPGNWTAEDDNGAAVRLHPEHGWIFVHDHEQGRPSLTLVPTCPECGGQSFGYEEGCSQYWTPGENGADENGADENGGTVFVETIGWDGIGDSGDGDPGLFCDNYRGGGCGTPIEMPDGWEMEWS